MAVCDKLGKALFPSWKELLERASSLLENENKLEHSTEVRLLIAKNNYLEAARQAKLHLDARWPSFLNDQFNPRRKSADSKSLSLAKAVWKLGCPLVITTNYDRVLKWACPNSHDIQIWDVEISKKNIDIAQWTIDRPTVWHVHGHIDALHNLILTPDGYSELYSNEEGQQRRYGEALETLRILMACKSMLFIGFSLKDEHLVNQIKWVKKTLGAHGGPHFALTAAREAEQLTKLLSGLPIEIIEFSDFGEPLISLMLSLTRPKRSGVRHLPQTKTARKSGRVWVIELTFQKEVTSYDRQILYETLRNQIDPSLESISLVSIKPKEIMGD